MTSLKNQTGISDNSTVLLVSSKISNHNFHSRRERLFKFIYLANILGGLAKQKISQRRESRDA